MSNFDICVVHLGFGAIFVTQNFLFVSKCPEIGAALYRNGIISILFSTIQTFD